MGLRIVKAPTAWKGPREAPGFRPVAESYVKRQRPRIAARDYREAAGEPEGGEESWM